MDKAYDIFLDTPELQTRVGELVISKGNSTFAAPPFQFVYDREYLNNTFAFELSPDLPLVGEVFNGRSHGREMIGAFADAMPDKWGRRLIERRQGQSRLQDIDYLLGVPDFTRQGALRFSSNGGESFLGPNYSYGGLEGLQAIHEAIVNFEAGKATEAEVELMLLTGSQSNGGQFPKTALIDNEGDLCIAKFQGSSELASPHWEATCLEMARTAGIEVPVFAHYWLDSVSVLVEKRFDRVRCASTGGSNSDLPSGVAQASRLAYLSAESFMTLPSHPTFVTPYTTFAQLLLSKTGPGEAQKLFCRLAFLLLVNNTDDHWKNHGLLYENAQWHLAPLFDVNPTILLDPYELPQIGSGSEQRRSVATLVENSEAFGLSKKEARNEVIRIAEVIKDWRRYAELYVRDEQEMENRSAAFSVQDAHLAQI